METAAIQQAQSFVERRHPEARPMHISSTCGILEGYHAPSILRPGDGGMVRKRETSPTRSRYVGNHNARPTQGARCPGLDLVGKDQLHYGDSDPDNHGRHPRVRDV